MNDITILEAALRHATLLSDIARRAKGHWGYSAAQLACWQPEFLTLTPEYIATHHVWIASTTPQQIVAFAAVEDHEPDAILEHLWVLPDAIGRGIGRQLFQHVASIFPEFSFTSDPHADEFYLKMGARQVGSIYSVLQQTLLTRFRYSANPTDHSTQIARRTN